CVPHGPVVPEPLRRSRLHGGRKRKREHTAPPERRGAGVVIGENVGDRVRYVGVEDRLTLRGLFRWIPRVRKGDGEPFASQSRVGERELGQPHLAVAERQRRSVVPRLLGQRGEPETVKKL